MLDKFNKVVDNYHRIVKPTLMKQGGESTLHDWFYRLASNWLAHHGIFPKDANYAQAIAKNLGKKYGEYNLYSNHVLPKVLLDEIISV